MDSNVLIVRSFEENSEAEWDNFVLNQSVNGTFLQTRRFLNYHRAGKFIDASYMVLDSKGRTVAVCPACMIMENGRKTFFSHMGSTYGGIIIGEKWYKTHKVIEIIRALENEWIKEGFEKIILKQTPGILSSRKSDLLDYCYYYLRYNSVLELNLYVDFSEYNENILSSIAQGKRTNIHNCEKVGCVCRELHTAEEMTTFHNLLKLTLKKYDKEPIHTVDELLEFQNKRLMNECRFYGIFKDGEMIAGSMMFYFEKSRVAHAQYLCADPTYHTLSPMSYMYYSMLCEAKKQGYEKVSWGIVTEDMGLYLNEGLTKSKEAFGSTYGVNHTYVKELQ